MLGEAKLPRKVARTDDPEVVLAHAATIGPATERAVRTQLGRLEAELVAAGTRSTVVGALLPDRIRAFLVMHGLDEHVRQGRGHPVRHAGNLVRGSGVDAAQVVGQCGDRPRRLAHPRAPAQQVPPVRPRVVQFADVQRLPRRHRPPRDHREPDAGGGQ